MRKKSKIFSVFLIVLIMMFSISIGVFAYYEYYGKYKNVINIDGTIKLDAFDCLYPELRGDSTYGNTPENPYVIDSIKRLQNLINLNNTGKLKRSKTSNGKNIPKYYFCLEFDEESLPQVLNLLNQEISSIGNNDYPFEDELSGSVYAYNIPNTTDIVFLSGCIPVVNVKVVNENGIDTVYVDEVKSNLSPSEFKTGKYLKLNYCYDEEKCYTDGNLDISKIELKESSEEKYIDLDTVTKVHQMIANVNVVADTEQLDVGFFSSISSTGSVYDIILYNVNITCVEEESGSLFSNLLSLFNGELTHKFSDEEEKSDERHIGIFAGHIDGNAGNISIAGESNILINTENVNYYSNYVSVGYISEFGKIGNVSLSELVTDNFQNGGNVSGCLFADNIYTLVKDEAPDGKDSDGANYYTLKDIGEGSSWPGVSESNEFKYGSFSFLLSDDDDRISEIWQNKSELYMLDQEGYSIYGSALYCADEYRYSPEQQAGGSIIYTAASAKERKYAGVSSLKATGSVLDAGKYLITAYIDDKYYAVKIVAEQDGSGVITYSFDSTDAIDVTDFINDDGETVQLYQSCLWEVDEASSNPYFRNSRFEDEYLKRTTSEIKIADETEKSTFKVNTLTNSLYYEVNETKNTYNDVTSSINSSNYLEKKSSLYTLLDGVYTIVDNGSSYDGTKTYYEKNSVNITTQYYLTFNKQTKKFRMTSDQDELDENETKDIYIFQVSNGYIVRPVTTEEDIVDNGEYLIVARNNTNSYLLGISVDDDGTVVNKFNEADYSYVTQNFPTNYSVSQYEDMKKYIWTLNKGNTSLVSFVDKLSTTCYISKDGNNNLVIGDSALNWTYTKNGDAYRLSNNGTYISYAQVESNTGFKSSSSAYDIYLYRIVPQDDTPLYITYESAKYVDAKSTTLEAGEYLIVATYNGNDYALTMNGSTTNLARTSINVNNLPASNNQNYPSYKWLVGEQSSQFKLTNVKNTARYLNANNTTLNTNTSTSTEWMYDASSSTFFYMNGNTKYYLTCNGTSFSLTTTKPTIPVKLYKCETQYQYTGVKLATITIGTTGTSTRGSMSEDGYYIVSYADLNDDTKSQFLVGTTNSASPAIQSLNITGTYTLSGEITTNSNVTMTTQSPMGLFTWEFEYSDITHSNRNIRVCQFDSYEADVRLAVSSSGGNRMLIATTANNSGPGGDNPTYFQLGSKTGATGGEVFIGFCGRLNNYVLVNDTVEGTFKTIVYSNNNLPQTPLTMHDGVTADNTPKIYYASGLAESNVANLITSDGDVLEKDIHYMFVAEENDNYYAMTRELDEDNNDFFAGTNVTSTVDPIIKATNDHGSYDFTTNVPQNADWTDFSNGNNLQFYHTKTSSDASHNFLDVSNGNFILREISSKDVCDSQIFKYDIINKILTCTVSGVVYYVTYDSTSNVFGLTTDSNKKAQIHMMRYSPTYKVEIVTSFKDENGEPILQDGTFIIAGHDVNGYIAIGTDGNQVLLNKNITEYLTSELSEAKYKSILNYIFRQVYYDYNFEDEGAKKTAYLEDIDDNKITFQQLTESNTGSISVSGSNLLAYASAYEWQIELQNDGTWKFLNKNAFGSNGALSKGITFTPSTKTSKLTIKDPNKAIGSYLGNYETSLNFVESDTSNFYLYNTDGTIATTINESDNYLIVGNDTGVLFAFGNNNGTIENLMLTTDSLSTITGDNKYLWKVVIKDSGYQLINNNRYATFNDNKLTTTNTLTNIFDCFTISNGMIQNYQNITSYTPYRTGNTAINVEKNSRNKFLKLYIMTYTSRVEESRFWDTTYYTYTLTPTDDPLAEGTKVLVSYDGTNYYWLRTRASQNNNGLQASYQLTVGENGVLTYPESTNNYTTYGIITTTRNTDGTYRLSSANNVYVYFYNNTNYRTNTNATNWYYDETIGFYTKTTETSTARIDYVTGFSSIEGISGESEGIAAFLYKYSSGAYVKVNKGESITQGTRYILFIQGDDEKYYLVKYDSSNDTISTIYIGSSIDTTNIPTEAYLIASAPGAYGNQLQFNNTGKYLDLIDEKIVAGPSNTTYWEYSFDDTYTTKSRLFTVALSSDEDSTLSVSGNNIVSRADGNSNTYLYTYTTSLDSGNKTVYHLGTIASSATNGTEYAIVIYENGLYYIVTVDEKGNVIPTFYGSGLPSEITESMLFKYGTDGSDSTIHYFQPHGDNSKYLKKGENGALALIDNYINSKWTYEVRNTQSAAGTFSNTSPNANGTSKLNLFKISKNDSLDNVSDTKTKLVGKTRVKSSLSVLSSTNYIITAEFNNRVYLLAMKDMVITKTLDITDTFNEAMLGNGNTIRLYDASVWNQIGSDYSLIFDSYGFNFETYNLLTGDKAYENDARKEQPVVININSVESAPGEETGEETPKDLDTLLDDNEMLKEDFVWNIYTYGENEYVLGNYDERYQKITYMYFDTNDLQFKLTDKYDLAKTTNNKVQIYQLGNEVVGGITYQTFEIKLKEDGVTIESYPLNESTPIDIKKYDASKETSTSETVKELVEGEYMVAAKVDESYYTIYYNAQGQLSFIDISLLFSGNFLKDDAGYYCVSINQQYLWKQTGTPVIDGSGAVTGLKFTNFDSNTLLSLGGSDTFSFDGKQLKASNGKYLSFSTATGFIMSDSESPVDIIIYSIGTDGVASGGDEEDVQYTYYSYGLNTNALNYSNFAFDKYLIEELPNYGLNANGSLGHTEGWKINSNKYLTEVNSSVYFKGGINYTNNLENFENEFNEISYKYITIDEETEEETEHEISYFAPNGAVSIVIPKAAEDSPVFINVIVSTEIDEEEFNNDTLRYLALWKVANFDPENEEVATLYGNNLNNSSDFAQTLYKKFYTPDGAIPMANYHFNNSSLIKVNEKDGNDETVSTIYHLNEDAPWNHLLAHTFTITNPGVYYLGSTYGTVTYCYVSIDDMLRPEEGEDDSSTIDDKFSIDFVYGTIGSSGSFGDELGLGTVCYVGKYKEDDKENTWTHSNIYPEFINGTRGLYDDDDETPVGEMADPYNPTDTLDLTVKREIVYDDNLKDYVSTVYISAETLIRIDDNKKGIMYINSNDINERVTKKVVLEIIKTDEVTPIEP